MNSHTASHSSLPLGLASVSRLPMSSGRERWDRIVVDGSVRQRLQSYSLFLLEGDRTFSQVAVPAHGIVLLSGPPGTGKTTLAHGLADWAARELVERGMIQDAVLAVIDPHAMESDLLGATERAVSALFTEHLPELGGPDRAVIVILDEVETLAISRQRISLDTNPVDVYRSTNSMLTGLDALSAQADRFLVVATSNDPRVLDEAFLSRVDLHETIGLPTAEAIALILRDCFEELTGGPPDDPGGVEVLSRQMHSASMDARQVRKCVIRSVVEAGFDTALDPSRLTVAHVVASIERELHQSTQAAPDDHVRPATFADSNEPHTSAASQNARAASLGQL